MKLSQPLKVAPSRSAELVRLRRQLERHSYPRTQMGLIVFLTGSFGLLCSFGLLHAGLNSMALRYPVSLLGAYAFFLFLLWVWLHAKAEDFSDFSDLANLAPGRSSVDGPVPFMSGGGVDFAGGGASGSFEGGSGLTEAPSGSGSAAGDAASGIFDPGELGIPLLAAVLALGLALASLYVVYLAPALFAELLFDGMLSYSLYRHLRADAGPHWLSTAFRRTAVPFGLTGVFLVVVGAGMAAYAPGAHTVGQVIKMHRVDGSR